MDEEQLLATLLLIEGPPTDHELYKQYRERVSARITTLLEPELGYPPSTDPTKNAAHMHILRMVINQYYEGRLQPRSIGYQVRRRGSVAGRAPEEVIDRGEFLLIWW